MHYAFSRLSRLDVKWTDMFCTNNRSFYKQHHNPYYELIVVADGELHLQTDQSATVLRTGEALLLMPWEQHTGQQSQPATCTFFWVQFSCDPGMYKFSMDQASRLNIVHAERTELRTTTMDHNDMLILPRRHHVKQYYKLLALFEELVEAMRHPSGYFRFDSSLLVARMLQLIANDFLNRSHLDTSVPASYVTFHKLTNYLNHAYLSDISKEELESELDRKYEYLCQVFKKYAGISVHQYIHRLRVQRAQHLLLNTNDPVKKIAEEVGYQDHFYFSRMFKKITGAAPQHYRLNADNTI